MLHEYWPCRDKRRRQRTPVAELVSRRRGIVEELARLCVFSRLDALERRMMGAPLFCRSMSALCSDRTLHEENESDERDGDYGKDKKCVEVRES